MSANEVFLLLVSAYFGAIVLAGIVFTLFGQRRK